MNGAPLYSTHGSPARSWSLSYGIGTVRDAVILIASSAAAYYWPDSTVEFRGAVGLVVFVVLKNAWKWFTDTRRASVL